MQEGRAFVLQLPGRLHSSTRAETAAGLLTLTAQAQVTRITTDSKGFLSIHKRACRRYAGARVRPHCKCKNGDLSRIWSDAVSARGPDAIFVHWAKGHTTTQQQRERYAVSAHEAKCNAYADVAAGHAVQFHDPRVKSFVSWAHSCNLAAARLTKAYTALVVDVLRDAMVRPKQRRTAIGRRRLIAQPDWPDEAHELGARLPMKQGVLRMPLQPPYVAWEQAVEPFLAHLRWVPAQGRGGCTWLELLLLFEHLTGATVRVPGTLPGASGMIRTLCDIFRKHSLAAIDHIFEAGSRAKFSSIPRPVARFEELAIRTVLPLFPLLPSVPPQCIAWVTRALLQMRGHGTEKAWSAYMAGTLQLPFVHLVLSAVPRWREVQGGPDRPQVPWRVQCTSCGLPVLLPAKPLPLAKGWPRAACSHCRVHFRLGFASCVSCLLPTRECRCSPFLPQVERATRSRGLFAWLRGAPTTEPLPP